MIPKGYLWTLRLLDLAFFLAFGSVIMLVDPEDCVWSKPAFYVSLFLSLAVFFNLVLLGLRKGKAQRNELAAIMATSFRQGIWIALLAVVLLVLQSFRMLVWWDGLLAAGAIFLAEFYFISRS